MPKSSSKRRKMPLFSSIAPPKNRRSCPISKPAFIAALRKIDAKPHNESDRSTRFATRIPASSIRLSQASPGDVCRLAFSNRMPSCYDATIASISPISRRDSCGLDTSKPPKSIRRALLPFTGASSISGRPFPCHPRRMLRRRNRRHPRIRCRNAKISTRSRRCRRHTGSRNPLRRRKRTKRHRTPRRLGRSTRYALENPQKG